MDISRKRVIILGATGTIGQNALQVCRQHSQWLQVVGLHAHKACHMLAQWRQEWPDATLICSGQYHADADAGGIDALEHLITHTEADLVLNGIAGADGLRSSVLTLLSGKDLALANKESMVMAGRYLQQLAAQHHCHILPVDSEHASLFVLLQHQPKESVDQLILTASGGPFRSWTWHEMSQATPAQASKHPTWKMGQKISIDSASLANKGLEVIEAWRFFHYTSKQIDVVIHPQSMVHAMIKMHDGSLHTHISHPSMQLPIQTMLLYPHMLPSAVPGLSWNQLSQMTFEEVDYQRFPMLRLAYQVIEADDPYPIVYNAANEIAVQAFCAGNISFTSIADVVDFCLQQSYDKTQPQHIDAVISIDHQARHYAKRWCQEVK
jgi:1-deoxy-D-xylulose-5-phosphate reductoisomerase